MTQRTLCPYSEVEVNVKDEIQILNKMQICKKKHKKYKKMNLKFGRCTSHLYLFLSGISQQATATVTVNWLLTEFPLFNTEVKSKVSASCDAVLMHLTWRATQFTFSFKCIIR